MEIVVSRILLFLFLLSIIFIVYYIIRITHLLIGVKNDTITADNIVDIKNDLFESTKLKILWVSLSYFLFYFFI
jgi:hypothetical protein